MAVDVKLVKELRELTGAGVLECKKALEASGGDIEKAKQYLKERGFAKAAKKMHRVAKDGLIEAYIHTGGRVGAMIELNCETDFVARTDEFKALAHDLAMQVVAFSPLYVKPEDIPAEVIEQQKAEILAEYEGSGKPPEVLDKIVSNRLEKFYQEVCLLKQPFIRDENTSVEDVIKQAIAKLGENIVVRRFVRFELGETEG